MDADEAGEHNSYLLLLRKKISTFSEKKRTENAENREAMKVDTSISGRVALGGIKMRGLCIHSVSTIVLAFDQKLCFSSILVAVIWPATAQRLNRWRAKINNNPNDRLTPRIFRFTIVCGRYLLAGRAQATVVEEKAEKCFLFAHRTMCYLLRFAGNICS